MEHWTKDFGPIFSQNEWVSLPLGPRCCLPVLTRPQFKTCLYARFLLWPHNTHTSRCNGPLKYPEFKVLLFFNSGRNPKRSLPQWFGANCKVHANTILFLWYIAFIYILQELSQNSACPTPTIIMNQNGLHFYYSYHFGSSIALYGTSQ